MSPATLLTTQAEALRAQAQSLLALADTLEAVAQHPEPPPAPGTPGSPYVTIAQLCERHPAFTRRTVASWYTMRNVNGLASTVCEVGSKGGRLVIDEAAFLAWVERHKQTPRKGKARC